MSVADSSGEICEEAESVHEPATLKSDVVMSVSTSLLIEGASPYPHPTLTSAFTDVADLWASEDVRVALIADAGYGPIVGMGECAGCIDPVACEDPIAVDVTGTGVPPAGELAYALGEYACMFRPKGEAIRHFVAFTDTEPSPGEMMDLTAFMEAQLLEGDAAFHVGYMLGCSQMQGGMGLEPFALATGGSAGNICDGVPGVRTFLEELIAPRVQCTWPVEEPANNSAANLELTLLDGPSGGEMAMTKVADAGGCTPADPANPAFEWFVGGTAEEPIVRLCPGTCSVIQVNWDPGQITYRQNFNCPA